MKRGEFLAKKIEEAGFNNMSLAKETGVPYTTIRSMIERDLANASIDNVLLISKAIGISPEELADPVAWASKHNENIQTIAAHHDGEDWTDEELEDIKEFKEILRLKRQLKNKE